MSIGCFPNSACRRSWSNGEKLIPIITKQPIISSHPHYASAAEAQAIDMARFARTRTVGGRPIECKLIEIRGRYAYQTIKRAKPEISIRGNGKCFGSRLVEGIEILSVEPDDGAGANNQPKKPIVSLPDLIYDRAGQTIIHAEVSAKETARWLIRIKRVDRSAQQQNPEGRQYEVSDL